MIQNGKVVWFNLINHGNLNSLSSRVLKKTI